jgi:hypothetical protein
VTLFDGTSLIIVVNVTMDTISQIQGHLTAHQYGDLIRKAKLKGSRPTGAHFASGSNARQDDTGLAGGQRLPFRRRV